MDRSRKSLNKQSKIAAMDIMALREKLRYEIERRKLNVSSLTLRYLLDNGQIHFEIAVPRTFQNRQIFATRGSYVFADLSGQTHVVSYTYDENGFHPSIGPRNYTYYCHSLQFRE